MSQQNNQSTTLIFGIAVALVGAAIWYFSDPEENKSVSNEPKLEPLTEEEQKALAKPVDDSDQLMKELKAAGLDKVKRGSSGDSMDPDYCL